MPKNTSINTLEKFWTNLKKPNEDVKTNFFRLLSLGQRAGLGMRDSLVALQASEKNIEMRAIIEDMINKISEGASLGVAMGNHSYLFSTEEREMIVSAESIGSLPETLERIALDLEQFQKIRRKIKGAMTYPVVLILITIGAVIVLLIFVMPTIVDLFPSVDDLPYITKLMLSVSDYLKKNRFFLIAGIGALVGVHKMLMQYFAPYKIFWDGVLLKIPVVKTLTKTFHMYRFSKNFADFYKAGVSPVIALERIGSIFSNFFYQRKIREIKTNLEGGFSLSESLEGSILFDPLLIQIIDVGETTGNVDEVLGRASEFYKEQLEVNIAALMQLIEPVMMMFIATIIGGLVASIFLPMADLLTVMGG